MKMRLHQRNCALQHHWLRMMKTRLHPDKRALKHRGYPLSLTNVFCKLALIHQCTAHLILAETKRVDICVLVLPSLRQSETNVISWNGGMSVHLSLWVMTSVSFCVYFQCLLAVSAFRCILHFIGAYFIVYSGFYLLH